MPRYIDADALRNEFSERPPDYYTTGYILDTIDDQPTVTLDEVRGVGKWIMSEIFKGYAMCSCCEDVYVDPEWIYKDGKWNYCPNCGAKMEVRG